MAVHSKSSKTSKSKAKSQSSAARSVSSTLRASRRHAAAAAAANLLHVAAHTEPPPTPAAGGTPGRPPMAVPRKRARLDTVLAPDPLTKRRKVGGAAAVKTKASGELGTKGETTEAGQQQKMTGEYPIRSRPVAEEGTGRPSTASKGTTAAAGKTRAEGRRRSDRSPQPSPPGARRGRGLRKAGEPLPAANTIPPGDKLPGTETSGGGSRGDSGRRVGGDMLDPSAALLGVNGVHDPASADAPRAFDRRALRSQDGGSRSRSELSLYFPNYEELLRNEAKETELLTADTRVFITEDPPKSPKTAKTFLLHSPARLPPAKVTPSPRKKMGSALKSSKTADPLNHYQTLDFSNTLAKLPRSTEDPLTPDVFAVAHRRAERQEKQLRNIEKERAQHEKVQLERLYEGLRGPDWLRVMGISGVTEGDRRAWEGKRIYFIKEVGALLEKFRVWKEEEKRRKIEKEMAERRTSEDEDDEEVEEEDVEEEEVEEVEEDEDVEAGDEEVEASDEEGEAASDEENGTASSDGSPGPSTDVEIPDSDALSASPTVPPAHAAGKARKKKRSPAQLDVDALAAQQLHTEALMSAKRPNAGPWSGQQSGPSTSSHSSSSAKETRARGKAARDGVPNNTNPQPDLPHAPIASFFRKPHQRTTALAAGRRSSGRVAMAFGEPIPEVDEDEFALPREITTADARRASARSRRARQRGD